MRPRRLGVRAPVPLAGRLVLAALMLAAATGCDDLLGNGSEASRPLNMPVLIDAEGMLSASPFSRDTLDVFVPDGAVMGVIFDSEGPLAAQWGPSTLFDLIFTPGGNFAAIVPIEGAIRLIVMHADPEEVTSAVDYRIRVVAVSEAPEHADAEARVDGDARREWIDLPLDVDVFSVPLEQGDRFYIESSSDADGPVTVRVDSPGGASSFAFFETGPEPMPSQTFQAQATGDHRIVVYNVGLAAEVATSYRFRVVSSTD